MKLVAGDLRAAQLCQTMQHPPVVVGGGHTVVSSVSTHLRRRDMGVAIKIKRSGQTAGLGFHVSTSRSGRMPFRSSAFFFLFPTPPCHSHVGSPVFWATAKFVTSGQNRREAGSGGGRARAMPKCGNRGPGVGTRTSCRFFCWSSWVPRPLAIGALPFLVGRGPHA